jgi:hypothetical protein
MKTLKDFQVMEYLSKNMSPYESVTWLACPHDKLDKRTPHDMMQGGRAERVYSVLYQDVKKLKALKRKRRS